MILNWYYIFLIGVLYLGKVYTKEKKNLVPEELVNSIVENEIARKLPAGKVSEKKGTKRNRLAGSHMKAATDAINKLVDESIVNRVEEAEKEVSQMLLRNIEHHIQDAGKIFKSPDDKGTLTSTFDRSPCRDKLDSCEKLSQAGVCKTSRDAMRENCRHTCNYCHVMLDHDMQAKLAKELENHADGTNKVLSIKWRHGKVRKHRKHHLATDEVGMLGNDVKMHEQPELEKSPPSSQPALSRDDDEQAQELERIKGEANKLLAAQRKIKQEKLAEKERHEAEKLLETEKKIKEEEQRQIEVSRKHQRKKKKKKQVVHKPSAKGISSFASFRHGNKLIDEDAIPFLNEDPYPLTDFVTEYDKTAAYGRNSVLRDAKINGNVLNRNTKDQTDLKLNEDIGPEYDPGTKKYINANTNSRVEDIDYRMDGYHPQFHETINTHPNLEYNSKRNANTQTFGKLEDMDENYSPQHLILRYDNDKHESNNLIRKYDDTHTKHLDRSDVTETDSSKNEGSETNYEETGVDNTDIQNHLPILHEKDAILGKTRTHHNHHSRNIDNERRHTGLGQGDRKTYIDNKTNAYSKPKIKNDIQNMIDKAFGEVLETD